ncbi:MAG: FAD-dependent oxidoreductase [Clostridia bacterium]|nr:FAD-dependent oxidoreductase [Clostridia bacterium]
MLRIDNVKVNKDLNLEELKDLVSKKYRINKNDIQDFTIYKKSIDARDKSNVHYVYSFNVMVTNESKYSRYTLNEDGKRLEKIEIKRTSKLPPVIVGSGPAGLFAALQMVKYGLTPIILERGKNVEERQKDAEEYFKTGKVNESSNVQFGEGGAGTFSDGKLNTGISSVYIAKVLETFVSFGAPEQILYVNKPHIGTDNLVKIVKNIRKYIESKGGKYIFSAHFDDFDIQNGKIVSVRYNEVEKINTDTLVLATGHSSRDIFELMKKKNVEMEKKNFSVGVRIEHKQKLINKSQYGTKTSLNLPPAEYKLVYHGKDRSCYSFCMCPGGVVVASASEKNTIVTNGMSTFIRDLENANSALLVNVTVDDFKGKDILAAVDFQRKLEEAAYILGGKNGFAPAQKVIDFLEGRETKEFGEVKPTYLPGVKPSNLNDILPNFVKETLKEGIKYFGKIIKGFDADDSVITGVETRSSSPLKITRDINTLMSKSVYGLYPTGEGPGYAGGIMSAAIDGIKVANMIISNE